MCGSLSKSVSTHVNVSDRDNCLIDVMHHWGKGTRGRNFGIAWVGCEVVLYPRVGGGLKKVCLFFQSPFVIEEFDLLPH